MFHCTCMGPAWYIAVYYDACIGAKLGAKSGRMAFHSQLQIFKDLGSVSAYIASL